MSTKVQSKIVSQTSDTSKMHVLIATNNIFPDPKAGGSGRYVHETGQRLVERGHEVSVVTRRRGETPRHETVAGMSVFRYDGGVTSIPSAERAVTEWCKKRHTQSTIDLINFHGVLSSVLVDRGVPQSIPRVYTFHGPWGAEYRERNRDRAWPLVAFGARARKWLERYALSKTARTITLSSFMSEQLREQHPHAPDGPVVPGGVDAERFHPDATSEYMLDEAETVFLTVRRLTPRMGLESLLDAFASVHRRDPETHLYIAGDGPLRDDLKRQARSADLGNAVTFLGFVSEAALPGIYASADLFVLPTAVLEGFGLATLEALASGTPVVGTNVGGTPEILRPLTEQLPNAPSLLVNNTTQLAGRLAAWSACSSAVQSQAGTTAREYVCSELTWEQTTDEIEAVFREEVET